MAMETNNNKNATLPLAHRIATGVGPSTPLVLPPVAVDSSLASTTSPHQLCMVAKPAQGQMVPWRTILAAQKCVRHIARAIGRIGAIVRAQMVHGVVQEAPRFVITMSRRTTPRVDVDALLPCLAPPKLWMLMHQQWTLKPVTSLAAQRSARANGVSGVNAQARMFRFWRWRARTERPSAVVVA